MGVGDTQQQHEQQSPCFLCSGKYFEPVSKPSICSAFLLPEKCICKKAQGWRPGEMCAQSFQVPLHLDEGQRFLKRAFLLFLGVAVEKKANASWSLQRCTCKCSAEVSYLSTFPTLLWVEEGLSFSQSPLRHSCRHRTFGISTDAWIVAGWMKAFTKWVMSLPYLSLGHLLHSFTNILFLTIWQILPTLSAHSPFLPESSRRANISVSFVHGWISSVYKNTWHRGNLYTFRSPGAKGWRC